MTIRPDYLICTECDSPVYVFEWAEGKVVEILCETCGNEDVDSFLSEDEIDSLGEEMHGRNWWHDPRTRSDRR